MNNALPIVLCLVFIVLAAMHFYWALGGNAFKGAAVPTISGKMAFNPGPLATAGVGVAMLACAALIAAASGLLGIVLPHQFLSWLCYALSLLLLARAIGDFRLVGFFKTVRNSRFARLDSVVYSPLSLALSLGVFAVGISAK